MFLRISFRKYTFDHKTEKIDKHRNFVFEQLPNMSNRFNLCFWGIYFRKCTSDHKTDNSYSSDETFLHILFQFRGMISFLFLPALPMWSALGSCRISFRFPSYFTQHCTRPPLDHKAVQLPAPEIQYTKQNHLDRLWTAGGSRVKEVTRVNFSTDWST